MSQVNKYGLIDHYINDEHPMVYSIRELINRAIISKVINDNRHSRIRVILNTSKVDELDVNKVKLIKIIHLFTTISEILRHKCYNNLMVYEGILIHHDKSDVYSLSQNIKNELIFILGYNVFVNSLFSDMVSHRDININIKEKIEDIHPVINTLCSIEEVKDVLLSVTNEEVMDKCKEIESAYLGILNNIIKIYNKGKFINRKKKVATGDELISEYLQLSNDDVETGVILNTIKVVDRVLGNQTYLNMLNEVDLNDYCILNVPKEYDTLRGRRCGVFYLGLSEDHNDDLFRKINEVESYYDDIIIYDYRGKEIDDRVSSKIEDKVTYIPHRKGINLEIVHKLIETIKLEFVYVDYDILHNKEIRKKVFSYIKKENKIPLFNSYDKILKNEDVKEYGGWWSEVYDYELNKMLYYKSSKLDFCDMSRYTNDLDLIVEYLTQEPIYKDKFVYDIISNSIGVYGVSKVDIDRMVKLIEGNELNLSKLHKITKHSEGVIISEDYLKSELDDGLVYITSEYTLGTYNYDLHDFKSRKNLKLIE